jgi:hypothetical protein
MYINFSFFMTYKEKESILKINKFLSTCKEDPAKLESMRKYLLKKLTKIFDKKIKNSEQELLNYGSLLNK